MNLKQLQAMSDAELNELCAVKVMGWETSLSWGGTDWIQGFVSMREKIRWNPATDMNDALELVQAVGDDYNFELNRKPCGVDHLLYEAKFTDEDDVYRGIGESAPRCITIASILAKEESE